MPDDGPTVVVGRVGRSHGLDGFFVVEDASDVAERFRVGAELVVDGEPARVVGARQARGRPVIKLDRRVPRGTTLGIPVSALESTGDDEYYVFQLVGLTVEEGGERLGMVVDVAPGVADDVLQLDSGVARPMGVDCIRDVDLVSGRILVAPGFRLPG
jgi:ribosomal 30S subunit maturation factor RimM